MQLDLIDWLAEQQRLAIERASEVEAKRTTQVASKAAGPQDEVALLLRREDPGQNMRRFYRLSMARSLWGEWGVVRQWGRIGTQGQRHTHWHDEQDDATAERDRIAEVKRRRGYE